LTVVLNNVGTNIVDSSTIILALNGTSVPVTFVTNNGPATTLGYTLPVPPFASGSTQYTSVTVKDHAGNSYTATNSFVVPTFATLTPAMALPTGSVVTNQTGFDIASYAVDATPGNGVQIALNMLAGAYGPNVGDNSVNLFPTNAAGYYVWTNYINFDILATTPDNEGGSDFLITNGYSVYEFPGIPSLASTNTGGGDVTTENFALGIYSALQFTNAGLYTMGVNSDDAFATFTGKNPADILSALELGNFDGGRGSSDTLFQFFVQQPGIYGFRTVYEQGGGGANLEWFMVQPDGTKVLINDITNSIKAYQWIPTIAAPYLASLTPTNGTIGADPNLTIKASIVDGTTGLDTNTVTLKIDGSAVSATVVKSNGVTTVTYVPSPIFASLSSHTVALSFGSGITAVSASASFTIAQLTLDKVQGYFGELQYAAAYTPNGGGHTGEPGDYAIDFGRTIGGDVYVPEAGSFLNIAATNDAMTFSFWMKRYDISANSSAFWADSPSSNNGERGWQAHAPWSDDTIYFDTAGCCGGNTRLNAPINTFTNYSGTDAWWTNAWHHFVFEKQGGDKQVWIDGLLFVEGTGFDPLPTDFTEMSIGSDTLIGNGGGLRVHGMMDDFAVFSTALGGPEITNLFTGTSPSGLAATNGLLAYWDFNDAPAVATGPVLTVARGTNGTLTVSWTGSGVLEMASKLTGNASDWSAVTPAPTGNSYTTPIGSGALYFRVVSFSAPASLTTLTCTIATGNGPFATNGQFRITTSGVNYTLAAITPNVAPSSGTFAYSVSGNVGTANLTDSSDGPGKGVFTFTSPTTGTYVLTFAAAPGASQTGTFTIP
jgi:hypothetical protein